MSKIVVMNTFSQHRRPGSGSGDPANRVERRESVRRVPPAACEACQLARPPYVYLENKKHYCVECALVVVTTERIYPAGRREEDITLGELLRERIRLLPRLPRDRRGTNPLHDLPEELKAS